MTEDAKLAMAWRISWSSPDRRKWNRPTERESPEYLSSVINCHATTLNWGDFGVDLLKLLVERAV